MAQEVPEPAKIARPLVMPDQYTGEENWSDWLANFELCASINEWDDKTKASFLAVRLKKTAQQVYRDIPAVSRQDYKQLKEAMTTRFDTTKYTDRYKSEFKFIKRAKDEGLHILANKIRRLAALAYPTIEGELREELARDQFLDALDNREFRLKVRQFRPKKLDEAVEVACEIEAMEQAEDRRGIKAVHATEVNGETNPEVSATMKTNGVENVLKESLKIIEQNTAAMKEMMAVMKLNEGRGRSGNKGQSWGQYRKRGNGNGCWNCGKSGHYQARCPETQGNDSRLR